MSELMTIEATVRSELGSRSMASLRKTGLIPGVIYGHKQANVHVSLPAMAVASMVQKRARLVTCRVGQTSETCLVKQIQYDYLGDTILHVDLTRVDLSEKVRVEVPIELKGLARGTLRGGSLLQELVRLEVECTAVAIPEAIRASVAELDVGQSILVKDLVLPPGVTTDRNPDEVVCTVQAARDEEVTSPAASVEQEVLSKGKKEEETEK